MKTLLIVSCSYYAAIQQLPEKEVASYIVYVEHLAIWPSL